MRHVYKGQLYAIPYIFWLISIRRYYQSIHMSHPQVSPPSHHVVLLFLFLFAKGDFTLHSKHRYSSTSSSILHISIAKLLRTIPQHCPSIPFSAAVPRCAFAIINPAFLHYSMAKHFCTLPSHYITFLHHSFTLHCFA